MMWIGAIALAALAVIAVCTAVLNISEHRSADAKLKRLARQVVDSQEQERARLSRELHDGISQMLVSVKLLLESALARFERGETREPAAEAALSTGLGRLERHAARSAAHLARAAPRDARRPRPRRRARTTRARTERTGRARRALRIRDESCRRARRPALPDPVNTVLFRIAQEALTNIVRHSKATRAVLTLDIAPHAVSLTIADNGQGFDVDAALADPKSGVGLRNMRERLDALGAHARRSRRKSDAR